MKKPTTKKILRAELNAQRGSIFYYHVTAPGNVDNIMKEGLRANEDGEIFVITTMRVANHIAKTQVFLKEFAVIGIYFYGVTGAVGGDSVGEAIAQFHRIIRQERIAPEFLRCLRRCVPTPKETLVERMLNRNSIVTFVDADAQEAN